jgi:hypothetical protein
MRTETVIYHDYEIQASQHPPIWQAAIYPTKVGMVHVDWTDRPINGGGIHDTFVEARRRIDAAVSGAN